MKTNYLILIFLTAIIVSCTQKQKIYDFKRIELVEYRSYYVSGTTNTYELICRFFATIDSTGECKLIENYTETTHFKKFQISDTLLVSLIDRLAPLKKDIDIRPKAPIPYSGSEIRVVFYSGGTRRNIDFIETDGYNEKKCMRLYNYVQMLNRAPENEYFSDTAVIKDMRIKQLKILVDSCINPPESVRFIIR